MNKYFPLITVGLIALGAVLGGTFGRMSISTSAGAGVTPQRVTQDYSEAIDLVGNNYAGKVDLEKVSDGAMQGMLWTLDPHSSFFTSEEFSKLNEEQSSQYYGIGVSILQHRDGVYVQSVFPNTPAQAAGLKYGDRFVTVEGKDSTEWTSSEISKNVRGERGTAVKIKVDRVGSTTPIELEIVRGGVPLPSVRNYFMYSDTVGYVGFTGGFQQTSAEEIKIAVDELKKQGMKSLILDVRGNPGGILEQAIKVVSEFVPPGKPVVSVKTARTDELRELDSTGSKYETLPMVVVINGGSASASEILAGAIQDYGRGLIVGSDSFGKGLVQRVFKTPYGTGLTLTTGRYYTPFGRSLQRDYSSGSIYDYYSHLDAVTEGEINGEAVPKPAGSPVTIPDGRVLYGGRGIEPDIRVEATASNPLRGRIGEAVFFFVRSLVAGKVAGFESYRTDKQNFRQTIANGDLQVSDRLFEAFRSFTAAENKNGLTAANISSQVDFSKTRIRSELATANYSSEAGFQVMLEIDPQIRKALESMSEAAKLAASSSILRS